MQFTAAIALALSVQQSLPSDSVARALLTQRVSAFADSGKHGSGIVVGLLDARGTRRIVAVGVDGSQVFEIGSITKAFTASLLADMAARGEVRLDDPVAKYLPPSAHVPSRNGKQITLVDLATQSSGLPRLPTNLAPRNPANPYADYSVEQLYAFLSGYELPRDVGATYEYSNLGMGLLGHALALKAGTSYENLVNRRLLTPLGMRETAITLSPALRARLAPGHDGEGNVVPNWDLPTLAGAGAVRSTAFDMRSGVSILPTSRRSAGRFRPLNPCTLRTGTIELQAPHARGMLFAILRRPTRSWRLRFRRTRSGFFRTTASFATSTG